MPVPNDIHLPLPVDPIILQALLVLLFLAHILFVNLMVGGSLFAVVSEIMGLKRPEYDTLAREIGKTITVNKSLAVVLGVGPLLGMNVLYTVYFYSANALTGTAWILIVPLVAAAFLISYVHKYSWDVLTGHKWMHITIGIASTVMFLCIPFIFLSNINLMLFPDRWTEVRGFLSSLTLPNVLPRFLHFLLACVAVTAFFLIGYMGRRGYPVERIFETWDRPALRRKFYLVAFAATAGQLLAGPLLFFTLPSVGMSWLLAGVVVVGVSFALVALWLMLNELMTPSGAIGRRYVGVVGLITATIVCMGYGRHVYREEAVSDHRALVTARTASFEYAAAGAAWAADAGVADDDLPLGQRVFRDVCSSCHGVDTVVAAPPLTEIASIYGQDVEGVIRWVQSPGRKRPEFTPMPAFRLGDEKLRAVAEYILELGADPTEKAEPPTAAPAESAASPSEA